MSLLAPQCTEGPRAYLTRLWFANVTLDLWCVKMLLISVLCLDGNRFYFLK